MKIGQVYNSLFQNYPKQAFGAIEVGIEKFKKCKHMKQHTYIKFNCFRVNEVLWEVLVGNPQPSLMQFPAYHCSIRHRTGNGPIKFGQLLGRTKIEQTKNRI